MQYGVRVSVTREHVSLRVCKTRDSICCLIPITLTDNITGESLTGSRQIHSQLFTYMYAQAMVYIYIHAYICTILAIGRWSFHVVSIKISALYSVMARAIHVVCSSVQISFRNLDLLRIHQCCKRISKLVDFTKCTYTYISSPNQWYLN